jgi:hypothetical protein
MAIPERSGIGVQAGRVPRCTECGAALADDQRYCVECGQRRGPLPLAIAGLIGLAPRNARERPDEGAEGGFVPADAAAAGARRAGPLGDLSPAVTGVAVMALLAFGVLLGSAVSPVGQSAAVAPIVVAVSPSTTSPSSAPASAPVSAPAATPAPAPETAPAQGAAGVTTIVERTPTTQSEPTNPPSSGSTGAAPLTLPPITHVFLIVLSDQGFNAAFGPSSQAQYLSKTLTRQGELVNSYYAVAGGELANEIALISGQGPTPQTAANCPLYTDVTPGSTGAQGQVLGSGCVYPLQAPTLADQLTNDGRAWKAYDDGIGNGGPGQPTSCRHPAPGSADAYQTPTPGDPYVTWRDPFVYFHGVIDNATCASSVVRLDQLTSDLKTAPNTPALAYIIPDRCHDGSAEACAPGQPSGLAPADGFLRKVVPEIESSPAYRSGGLIAITFDQAPQSGPNLDSSGCCTTATYPNLPAGATGASGATTPTGATGTSGTAGPTAGAQVGGGQVGMLLLSKYVKPGSINVTGQYNHFSFLASIENLFGLGHLGYAGSQGLLTFDTSVFNVRP